MRDLEIQVRATAVDAGPGSLNRAIVNGHVVKAFDEVRDSDDRKIPGLFVANVLDGSVRFTYQDVEFTRVLAPP